MKIIPMLIPSLLRSLDVVAREMTGVLSAVTRDSSSESIAVGQKINFPVSTAMKARDAAPAAKAPDVEDVEIKSRTLEITKSRAQDIIIVGNDEAALGAAHLPMLENQMTEAMRGLINEAENDACSVIVSEGLNAGNSVGTSGTTPFASDISDLNKALMQLKKKGAPTTDLELVLNPEASENLRNLKNLQSVSDSGNDDLLRRGVFGRISGFDIRESAGFGSHTKGTGDGYLVNGGARQGEYVVPVDTGTGTFVKGDLVKFGSSGNSYVIAENAASGTTSIRLISPLQEDVADNAAVTIGTNYLASLAFPRSSVWLATRTVPNTTLGDQAIEQRTITDPKTGLALGVCVYPEYKRVRLEVNLAWGVGVIKPEFIVPILG